MRKQKKRNQIESSHVDGLSLPNKKLEKLRQSLYLSSIYFLGFVLICSYNYILTVRIVSFPSPLLAVAADLYGLPTIQVEFASKQSALF